MGGVFRLNVSPATLQPAVFNASAAGGWPGPFDGSERDIAYRSRPGARDVIGSDNRVPVPDATRYPFRAIVHLEILLEDDSRWTGTGWLASPTVVLTAGHCLLSYTEPTPHRAKLVRVFPSSNSPEPSATYFDVLPHAMGVSTGWAALRPDGTTNDPADYGFLRLPQPIGKHLGWFGVGRFTDEQLTNMAVNLIGYPDAPDNFPTMPFGTMWGQQGAIEFADADFLYYTIDTSCGQSGSPVFTVAGSQVWSAGIHVSGNPARNNAIRFNPAAYAEISSWLAQE